jgi:HlyD family secretion protein
MNVQTSSIPKSAATESGNQPPRGSRRKTVLLAVVLLAMGGGAGFFYWNGLRGTAAPNELLVSGNIEAHQSLVSFKDVTSRITDLPFDEGQWVDKGQVLARVDDSNYKQQVAVDEAAVRVRQEQLASARENLVAARHTVANDEADFAQKQLDYKRFEELWKAGATSAQSRDQADTAMKRAEAMLKHDQAMVRVAQQNIGTGEASVKDAEETLRLAKITLGYTVLRAPFSGVVLVRQTELGEVMQPGTPVVTLADLDHVWLRAYVSETDLGKIRWDQPAIVTTDTYPDKKYRGHISFIASNAEFTPKSVQTHEERVTLVYRIKIDVDNPNHELKPGMPADALIQLGPAAQRGSDDGQPVVRH